jgi:2-dehydropantoate 2-reductase
MRLLVLRELCAMRIAIVGAGAVGGYFGAQLVATGTDVTFLARGAQLAALRENGLVVESALGPQRLARVQATDDPRSVGPVDVVVVAVKLWSTAGALESAAAMLGTDGAVVSFQNGVDAVRDVSAAVGPEHTLGGVAHIAATIDRPGVIRHTGKLARLSFGELDGRPSARTDALLFAARAAGIDAQRPPDIHITIWEKFVFLVGMSGMTALTRRPIGAVRDEPLTREMLRDVMAEVVAVGRAAGVGLDADLVDRQLAFVDGLPALAQSSMLSDLQKGNRLELPWLAGAVVRLGKEHGVPTPTNRMIYGALKMYELGSPA